MRAGWLVVLSQAEGIRWVLRNEKMAFSEGLCKRAGRIAPGDTLFFYASRLAFANQRHGEPQLIALGIAKDAVKKTRRPVRIAGRAFQCVCPFALKVELPELQGVPFIPLVRDLRFIRRKQTWHGYLLQGLIHLPEEDARLLTRAIQTASNKLPSRT